ncbi:hypothetical protein FA13DRAFT_615575 [Coprinellus micaceus]|uniref:TEA domain-containing protein n=1 Tax=Coprinellus micaceus TaxID=71717 RepID=A0A4Y7SB37_COPMI|nr:hypothetical protein FA13DRAFT_615575 [Coprinellus micaceus]
MTGKTRTHKQVGSRLQQLRDTCEDSRRSCEDLEDECKQNPEAEPCIQTQTLISPLTYEVIDGPHM